LDRLTKERFECRVVENWTTNS